MKEPQRTFAEWASDLGRTLLESAIHDKPSPKAREDLTRALGARMDDTPLSWAGTRFAISLR